MSVRELRDVEVRQLIMIEIVKLFVKFVNTSHLHPFEAMAVSFGIFVIIAGLAPLIAASLPLFFVNRRVPPRLVTLMLGISAGLLFAIATLDLIPEGYALSVGEAPHNTTATPTTHDDHDHEKESNNVGLGIGFGFIGMLFMQQLFSGSHSHHVAESDEESHDEHAENNANSHKTSKFSKAAIAGLTVHSLIDGIVLASAFSQSSVVGVRVAMAIIIHKFPDGFILSSVLVSLQHSNLPENGSRFKIMWIIIVSLATPTGAILGSFVLVDAAAYLLSFLLGVGAGSFLYISCTGIVPELLENVNAKARWVSLASIIGGYLLYFVSELFGGHSHG